MRLDDEAKTGYIFEVSLKVLKELHDYFNDYPLAPESREGEVSPLIKHLIEKHEINYDNKVKKLIPNLYDKEKYVVSTETRKNMDF